MYTPIKTLGLLLLFLLNSNGVKADAYCGQTVTENLTLTADLYCAGDVVGYAFKIVDDGIIVNLNGFELKGDAEMDGIIINQANHVEIIGNSGNISGFNHGIKITDSQLLKINGISFYDIHKNAVFVNSVSVPSVYMAIRNNIFFNLNKGVSLSSTAGGDITVGYSQIEDNIFFEVLNPIKLAGSDYNSISNNLIWRSLGQAIDLDKSDHNYINNNRFFQVTSKGIYIDSSSNNLIRGNLMESGTIGISIVLDDLDGEDNCELLSPANRNKILTNSIFDFNTGIYLEGGARFWRCGEVSFNQINGNKLYDNQYGIQIGYTPTLNNLNGNAFQGTRIRIQDLSDGSNDY